MSSFYEYIYMLYSMYVNTVAEQLFIGTISSSYQVI